MRPNPYLAPPHGFLALVLVLAACDGGKDDTGTPPEGDADSDVDSDSDTDADTDTDTGPSGRFEMSEADTTLYGEWEHYGAGYDVAIADVSGDGTQDFLVGVGTIWVAVVYGPVEGTRSLATADAFLVADYVGQFEIESGDIDRDGIADILVGNWHDESAGFDSGAVYLVLGPVSGEVPLSSAEAVLVGDDEDDNINYPAYGDVDGDGSTDVLVGGVYVEPAGAASLFHGPLSGMRSVATAEWTVVAVGRQSAYGVTKDPLLEDLDGDGLDDVVVTAGDVDDCIGTSYVFLDAGTLSGTSLASDADAVLRGEETFGGEAVVRGTGDMDGDGLADLLAGTTHGGGAHDPVVGHAYAVFSPPAAGETSLADADVVVVAQEQFTFDYLSAGDVDGDGAADLLAQNWYLLHGPLSGTVSVFDAEWTFFERDSNQAVSGMSLFANLDDEAHSDVVFGMPHTDSLDVESSGAVYAFRSDTILERE